MQAGVPPHTCSGGVCAPTSVTAGGAEDGRSAHGSAHGSDAGNRDWRQLGEGTAPSSGEAGTLSWLLGLRQTLLG